ncbi:ABC transporter substrate-binding protein [Arthrobacter sp. RCC_34]|uniref:ABC transporter substrate-binding protein n=1 Tax=Arthrobacter sp. RCC_34 TaxID=3239230 RepID=UPI0035267D70
MRLSRRKTSLAVIGTVAIAALTLSGCGQKVNNSNTGASSNDSITYLTSWPADTPQAKIFATAADDFTKSTGIKVNIKELGKGGVTDVINASVSGNGPDLFDNAPDHVPAYRKAGLIADLSDVLSSPAAGESGKIQSDYPKSVLDSASDKDGVAFIPHTILSGGVWFDANSTPDLATKAPATWEEFKAALDKLKASGKTPIAQEGGNASYNVLWFYWLMLRSHGPGAVLGLSKSAAAWDDPAVLSAAKEVAALRPYFQTGYEGSRYPNAQNAWAQGKYALDLNGSWLAGEVKSVVADGAKLSTFPFPSYGKDSKSVEELNVLGWSVNAKGKNPSGAKDFVKFLVQKKYLEKIGSDALNIPARSDVKAPDALAAMQKSVLESRATTGYMDTVAAVAPTWYNDVLLALDDQLVFGKITPEQFVAQGKEKTTAYIASGTP